MVGLQDITILCNSILEWHKECNSQMLAGLRWNGDYIKLHYTFAIPPHFECKNPPHLGGVLCWVISKSRTWRKRTPRGEQPPKLVSFGKLVNFGGCSSGVVLFLSFLIWKPPKKETPPGGGGFLQRSTLQDITYTLPFRLVPTSSYNPVPASRYKPKP